MGEEWAETRLALTILRTYTLTHECLLRVMVPALTRTFTSVKALVSFLSIQHIYWARNYYCLESYLV